MKKQVIINSILLDLKLKERGILLNKITKKTFMLTAHLTPSEKDRLEKLAEYRHIRLNTLVDGIISQFEFNWDDIKFFHGMNKKGFIKTVQGLFTKPEDKLYVTFNLNKKSHDRITALRSKYELRRGVILTHLIKKYINA